MVRGAVLCEQRLPRPYAQSRPLRIETLDLEAPPAAAQLTLPHYQMVQDGRQVLGSYMGGCVIARDVPRYIRLYQDRKLPVDRLLSARIRLEDVNEGFDRLAEAAVVRQVIMLD